MDEALEVLRSEKKKEETVQSRLQQELSVISRQSSSRGALEALRRDRRAKEERYQTESVITYCRLPKFLGISRFFATKI